MKTHGPYNATTTIIKIDNELKQEDTAALVAFFRSFLLAYCWAPLSTTAPGAACTLGDLHLPFTKAVLRERQTAALGETSGSSDPTRQAARGRSAIDK